MTDRQALQLRRCNAQAVTRRVDANDRAEYMARLVREGTLCGACLRNIYSCECSDGCPFCGSSIGECDCGHVDE